MASPPPNYTQVPNLLLGDIKRGNIIEPGLMSEMKEGELKVYLAVCRMTVGYHQQERRASLKMVVELTGLSKQSVLTASKSLEQKEIIELTKDGGVTLWQLKVQNLDQDEKILRQADVQNLDQKVQNLDQGGPKFRPPSKKETIKETIKEKINGESPLSPTTEAQVLLFEKINKNRVAKRLRRVQRFQTIQQMEKCDESFERLGKQQFIKCLDYWMTRGIIAGGDLIVKLGQWNAEGKQKNENDQRQLKNSNRARLEQQLAKIAAGKV